MSRELLLSSTALAFFIICPRMAGMVHIIAKSAQVSIMQVALCGTLMAVPMVLMMVAVFGRFGLLGALIFCIGTDLLAAAILSGVSSRAAFETLVLAAFILAGVKVAPMFTKLIWG